ncbi:MAG TPA: hypothetical protein DCX32_01790 [Candidatus Moranbacteria bacterium]|nr:MAG: hypothetical protein UW87_C0009G0036 [Candidatus Moranbacteria bacterium GW2011_GWC2_45_10]KKT95116.1 MAG: hypothetical protein UW95_C0004G0034 [Parcubacteria group bacterium GW2011_GWC1_45_14]HAV11254.1 hypothetical protein [Candidatus Moranbacteria bacterium]
MELKNYNVYFFFIILMLVSMVTFFIFKPFLIAIILASVLAIIFKRPYLFFLKKFGGREGISSLLTSIMAVLVFVIPFFLVVGLVTNEVLDIYEKNFESGKLTQFIDSAIDNVNNNQFIQTTGILDSINRESLGSSVQKIGQASISILQSAYKGVAHFVFISFVVFFTLYYLLTGGKKVVEKIMKLSPLKDKHEKLLVEKFISISRATIKGTLVVAFIQGAIGGIAFAIAGVPSATLWGIIMMILSIVPIIGAFVVWLPVGIVMLLLGNAWEGIFILAVGTFIISLIDNFLRPALVGKDTQMHPLMVFFATLGGVGLFGFLGFILGPIIVALFLSLWDIYAVEFKKQLRNFNA